jgi:acyl-CoA synthetase (AMP-forming)/AMP-acid ligase II
MTLHPSPLQWLEDGQHTLDWNGPTSRAFTRFRDEDLDRPIIDQFERVARRHRNRVAVTDSDTSLSYSELWDGLSGLAETIAAETRPGDLIGIVLPTCSMVPLAMLACLAAGRPFVALDPHYPGTWLGQVLEDARPALIIGRGMSLEVSRPSRQRRASSI